MKHINNRQTYRYTITLIIAWIGALFVAHAQEGTPFLENISDQEYNAHNRNFDVVCDSSGIAYFANFEGILYYDGASWNKILTPGISRITRLYMGRNQQIWAGGYNFIGKISAHPDGSFTLIPYVSDKVTDNQATRIGEVLQIKEENDHLLFLTQNYQVTIHQDSILSILPNKLNQRQENYTQTINLSEQLQVRTDGINGISFLDKEGRVIYTVSEKNGLCSNTINNIATDNKGSVWGATDNGLFRINTPSFYSHFTSSEGLKGEVTAIHRHKQHFYVGTLHGLYLYDPQKREFNPLPAITQACWQLKEDPKGILYAASSNGLFRINNQSMDRIDDDNTFSLTFHPTDPQLIYSCELDGIYRRKGGLEEKIADIEKVMKLEFAENHLWAETLYGEIYLFSDDLSSTTLLDSVQGLKSSANNKLYIINNSVHILSSFGIQRWDEANHRFIGVDNPLNDQINNTSWWPGLYASTPSGEEEWFIGGDGKNPAILIKGQTDQKKKEILYQLSDYIIRTLYLEEDGIAWIGGDFGLIKLDYNQPDEAFTHKPEVYIRSISAGNTFVNILTTSEFNSDTRDFKFVFSSTTNDIINFMKYAYYLEGYDSNWSVWQNTIKKEYTNLSYGSYTFRVKVLDAFGRESEEKSFSFTIQKPFYLKWYCILVYISVFIFLIFLFFKWRTHKLLQEKIKLERIVEQRTQQIREQRDEISEKSQKLEVALTELGEAQDQLIHQEKAATVGKLTQGLIDRILNPLNYIINFSHLSTVLLKDMKEDMEDEEENISKENYDDMEEIMEMLNTHLSKIKEHGNSTSQVLKAMEEMLSDHSCHFAPTNINKLIQNNLDILKGYYQNEIREANIEIVFESSESTLEIMADQLQLGKALMSMMQNCIHALRKKKNQVAFQATMTISLIKQGSDLHIRLHDNGIGIEQSILDKIFDPFFTTKTTSEGAGVGLYLSREIILSHNGKVDVKSIKGDYTEFTLSIPIHQSFKSNNDE